MRSKYLINFIWDLDGTLLNSYEVILTALEETFSNFNLKFDYCETKEYILKNSVVGLLKEVADKNSIPYNQIKPFFSKKNREKKNEIFLMNGAKEILLWTKEKNIQNYVYTHKSNTAKGILENLAIDSYFIEIVTSDYGFNRKPNPQAIDYLVDKYEMNRKKTYYIGDRTLDKELAINGHINSINLSQESNEYNLFIPDLNSIRDIADFQF